MDDNKQYKIIKIKKGDKMLTALQVKKKTNLIYCKRFLKKLTRTDSNSSTSSSSSVDNDLLVITHRVDNINIDIINNKQ